MHWCTTHLQGPDGQDGCGWPKIHHALDLLPSLVISAILQDLDFTMLTGEILELDFRIPAGSREVLDSREILSPSDYFCLAVSVAERLKRILRAPLSTGDTGDRLDGSQDSIVDEVWYTCNCSRLETHNRRSGACLMSTENLLLAQPPKSDRISCRNGKNDVPEGSARNLLA